VRYENFRYFLAVRFSVPFATQGSNHDRWRVVHTQRRITLREERPPMAAKKECKFYRWDSMKKERVSDMLERRLITGDRMMLAHVYLKKGCIVPKHSHENEQLTYILEGALKFWIGEDGAEEITVRAGEVLLIPSNIPHKAEALEETLDVDVFSPPRQDWLDKKDDYLRR
jgi:quercetin dioxygenase-like cupin family protein